MEKKFYQKTWFSILTIFFFFPLGYFIYYKYHSAKLETKGAIFLISFIIFAIASPFNMQTFITIYIPFFIYMGLIGKKQESLKKASLRDEPVGNNHLNIAVEENKTIQKSQNIKPNSSDISLSVKIKTQAISIMHSEAHRNTDYRSLTKDPFWYNPNIDVSIKNYIIHGGMIYYGHPNSSYSNAALIDPHLYVDKSADDYINTKMGYWPAYNDISPQARGCYLSWLSDGRKDPDANIGYIFLYFYGLEQRLLLFVNNNPVLNDEKQLITAEIKRLLSIYGENGSFHMYATSLLSYVNMTELTTSIQYDKPAPKPTFHRGIPLKLKIGIAQMAKNQIALPAEWALSWYLSLPEPPVYSRTIVHRCYPEFHKLFTEKYKKRFNNGLSITPTKTKLSCSYRPSSGTLLGGNYTTTSELSDISTIKKYTNSLVPLIQECYDELDHYSRFLGRNPDKVDTIDALLVLPVSIWSNEIIEKFKSILTRIDTNHAPLSMKFSDFLKLLLPWENRSKSKLIAFLDIAETYLGIGMEPDCRFQGKVPKDDTTIVIFSESEKPAPENFTSPSYSFATLILHLNLLVSQADGKISQEEKLLLINKIDSWTWIKDVIKPRLKAYAEHLSQENLKITGLKNKITGLTSSQKEFLGSILVQIAKADGTVSIDEIQLLEKIFKLLELDKTSLYGQINQSGFEPMKVAMASPLNTDLPTPSPSGIQISKEKLASIKTDSEKVASLLNEIFTSEEDEIIPESPDKDDMQNSRNLWSLSLELSEFTKELTKKVSWNNDELIEIAAKRGLMLEGSLEEINDAAFDNCDEALFDETDDGIEMNQDVVKAFI